MRLAPCGQTSDPAFASPMSVEIEMSAERPDAETRRLPKGSRKDLDSSSRPLRHTRRKKEVSVVSVREREAATL